MYVCMYARMYIYIYIAYSDFTRESKGVIIQIQFLCSESTFSAQIAEGFVVC